MAALFFQAAAIGLAAAASPGAFQAFMVNQTLLGGWRRGAPVALSVFISDPPIIFTILLLLDQLPDNFMRWIGLAGGLFVLYMAWGVYRSLSRAPVVPNNVEVDAQSAQNTIWKIFLRGALMNLLSPGPYTFWTLVLGPLLLDALRQSPWHGLVFLAGFYSLFISGMLGIVLLFHLARRMGPKVVRLLTQASIVILVLFGLLLLAQALTHPHDAAAVYYRSRPFMLACGLSSQEALAAGMTCTGGPTNPRLMDAVLPTIARIGEKIQTILAF